VESQNIAINIFSIPQWTSIVKTILPKKIDNNMNVGSDDSSGHFSLSAFKDC